jgi:hypothetical protein
MMATVSHPPKQETDTEETISLPLPLSDESASSLERFGANSNMYKYNDYAKLEEHELAVPTTPASGRGSTDSSIRAQKFPVKLYAILAQKEFHDIITWMHHGRSWKVLKPTMFESMVMPLFFEYSNYHSFNRLVNAWSFRRVGTGPDRGSYYHEVCLLLNEICSVRCLSLSNTRFSSLALSARKTNYPKAHAPSPKVSKEDPHGKGK